MSTKLTSREALPVEIGSFRLYCEEFKASGVRSFSETASVSGDDIISNSCPKAAKVTFSGRICDEESPLGFIVYADNMMRSAAELDISYRGVEFSGCRIQSFSAEDRGEDYISASITLITPNNIRSGEVT
ncbi:MAG: hypothetical protein J6L05_00155 [Ruminococcus sp.]|nr:hypothetical protein [Ruminococcus sp.]